MAEKYGTKFQACFRLFDHAVQPEGQADKKIRRYSVWGMLPLGLFSLRWNIETSYYETKTFWSFCDYMTPTANGIERLENL